MLRVFILFCVGLCCSSLARASDCAEDPARTRISRVVAIDSSHGFVYGQTASNDASTTGEPLVLQDREVVLTFDSGPQPAYTSYILDILDRHCVRATFFFNGREALNHAQSVRDAERRGHTIAARTWSGPRNFGLMPPENAKIEIEKGFLAVSRAAGKPAAPFFRSPDERFSPETLAYLASRNISLWPADIPSGDADESASATKIANRTIDRVKAAGKGVIQLDGARKATVDALDSILHELKLSGFKVVHIVPSTGFVPDEELASKASLGPQPSAAAPVERHFVASAKRRLKNERDDRRRMERLVRSRDESDARTGSDEAAPAERYSIPSAGRRLRNERDYRRQIERVAHSRDESDGQPAPSADAPPERHLVASARRRLRNAREERRRIERPARNRGESNNAPGERAARNPAGDD